MQSCLKYKRCSRCGTQKPTSEFGTDRRNKDGLNVYCKECKKSYNDQQFNMRVLYRHSHKEEQAEYSRRYRKEHPDNCRSLCSAYRTKKTAAGGRFTQTELNECLLYFDYRCAYSGELLPNDYHLDHVVPVSKGGTSCIHNVVPCLPTINISKSSSELDGWYVKQPFYSEERHNRIKEWCVLSQRLLS